MSKTQNKTVQEVLEVLLSTIFRAPNDMEAWVGQLDDPDAAGTLRSMLPNGSAREVAHKLVHLLVTTIDAVRFFAKLREAAPNWSAQITVIELDWDRWLKARQTVVMSTTVRTVRSARLAPVALVAVALGVGVGVGVGFMVASASTATIRCDEVEGLWAYVLYNKRLKRQIYGYFVVDGGGCKVHSAAAFFRSNDEYRGLWTAPVRLNDGTLILSYTLISAGVSEVFTGEIRLRPAENEWIGTYSDTAEAQSGNFGGVEAVRLPPHTSILEAKARAREYVWKVSPVADHSEDSISSRAKFNGG